MKKSKEAFKQEREKVKARAKKLGPVKLVILSILAVGTVCSFVLYDYIFGEWTVFTVNYGSDFVNGLMGAIPKIIRCVQIITITAIITTLVLFVISRLFTKSQRSKTVSRLCCNLIKWVVAIILVIVVLAVWGVDTTALITGAGVLTLVVGLGMQSLIADVIAGLFIVFENEFNLGDIITVDDFRGEVVEMGIRTTKLKAEGNIKIFNNSDLRKILNQTIEPSVAKAYIDIEYGADLGKVEEIIARCLPEIKIEGAVEGVTYNGVSSLGASGVQLYFSVKCKETDIFSVQRALNGELKNMFDKNGINIPFNQIVIHNAD
ncbi:MAG: mechanosensitive ion channel family protein [Clostridia bacterium]|nr:mechanosensitive ion channel family protein [Clostridia bacterium]